MGESCPRSCVQTSLRSVCTHDLGQDSPIQTHSDLLLGYKEPNNGDIRQTHIKS